MNTNPKLIAELEINKKIAYYHSKEFENKMIEMMIPDAVQYVHKICHCWIEIKQSRLILDDIRKQILEMRQTKKTYYASTCYKVGTLSIDSRAYAQQNIQLYCHYIAETNDCIMQILNIVFNLGKGPWDHLSAQKLIANHNLQNLSIVKDNCENFHKIIETYKELDNYDKHNLILWGVEQFSPEYFTDTNYYFKINNQTYSSNDLVNEQKEYDIKHTTLKLLDSIFDSVSSTYNPMRYYVDAFYDLPKSATIIEHRPNYSPKNLRNFQVEFSTKPLDDLTIVDSISHEYNQIIDLQNEIYLADLRRIKLSNQTEDIDYRNFIPNKIDVYKNNAYIGYYECCNKNDINANYFHFKHYMFKSINK